MKRNATLWWLLVAVLAPPAILPGAEGGRCSLWIDLCQGEPVSYDEMLDDLAKVRVIYAGEHHTILRDHQLQERLLADLAGRAQREGPSPGGQWVLAMEQLESFQQPAVDRFNRGEIPFDQLAEEVHWSRRWPNFQQYRPIVEAAGRLKVPVLALNARSEAIRQVARGGGIERLDRQSRAQLPREIQLEDPSYRQLLSMEMMVHAAVGSETLRPMIEAQIARDEAMAQTLAAFLQSPAGRGRSALVICGTGHVAYGLGTPSRVRRRMPEAADRIVLFSESGDLVLSPAERAMARPITISHQQWRQIDRPVADYLFATSRKENFER
jgi:uncharacterized iron-regulated protein